MNAIFNPLMKDLYEALRAGVGPSEAAVIRAMLDAYLNATKETDGLAYDLFLAADLMLDTPDMAVQSLDSIASRYSL